MNIYGTVDALFISNLIGTDGLSAQNITMPILMIALAISVMVATGGSALTARLLGERKQHQARQTFTFLILFSLVISVIICVFGYAFRFPLLRLLGADDALYALCEDYAVVIFFALPFALVGMMYQTFLVTSGNPRLGFTLSIIGGVMNIVLDYVLIGVCDLGMTGAALATAAGYTFQSIGGTVYFIANRKGLLCFVRPRWDSIALFKSLSNGMSEMVNALTGSISMIAMNVIMMKLVGSDGVAAVAIVLTMQMLLSAVYMGYLSGVAPVTSYHFGRGDTLALKKIYRAMKKTVGILSVVTCVLCVIFAMPLALLYASGNESVISLAVTGTRMFALAFLVMGFNIMASSMFTALNDGKTSAILSFFRTFVFLMVPLLILPAILGAAGVWVSLPLAELLAILLSAYELKKKKSIFHYA